MARKSMIAKQKESQNTVQEHIQDARFVEDHILY